MYAMVLRGCCRPFYDNNPEVECVPLNEASAHAADLLHRVVEGQVAPTAVVRVANEVREQAELHQRDAVMQRLRLASRVVERVLLEHERLRLLRPVAGQRVRSG